MMIKLSHIYIIHWQIKTELITCVKMEQSVDYVVAAGTASGQVFIFQLPSYLPGRNKQVWEIKQVRILIY